jgi:hypothetical protein
MEHLKILHLPRQIGDNEHIPPFLLRFDPKVKPYAISMGIDIVLQKEIVMIVLLTLEYTM